MAEMTENELSNVVIGAAIEVHRELGPGLLESAYEMAVERELGLRGLHVQRQVALPLVYKGAKCEVGYRIDLLVEKKIVLEVKCVEALTDVHLAQVLTYLRLTGCKVGLLMNFNEVRLKDGLRRVVSGLDE